MKKPDIQQPALITSGGMSDNDILMAYIDSLENEINPRHNFPALVAQQISMLDVRGGAELVLPVAGLVMRTIKSGPFIPSDDDSLVGLINSILGSNDSLEKMQMALALGDRGTMFASAIGGQHLKRIMHPKEAYRYSVNMAMIGYETALSISEILKGNCVSKTMHDQINLLMKRFSEVVLVLRGVIGFEVKRVLN